MLKKNGLCISDIDAGLNGFVVVRNNGNLIGTGGLEFFGDTALLRSVAVEALYRGQKIAELKLKSLEEFDERCYDFLMRP